jgi:hypothetical protein
VLNFALAALAISVAPAAADAHLAWKFKEGDVLRYRILQDVHQTISGMSSMEVDTKIEQVLREKVQSVAADGTAKIEVTWEALRFHASVPMAGEIDFDSTKDAPESAAGPVKSLAKVVGSAFQLEMKPNGEIVSLRGIDELMEKLSADGSTARMKDVLSKSFNDVSMKRALETVVLPEKAIGDGGTWKRTSQFDVPSIGKMQVDFDFKLEGTEEAAGSKCAKVGVLYVTTLAGGKPDTSSMPGAQNFDVDLAMDDAKGQGSILFSADLGRMVRTQIASDMNLSMNLKPKGDPKAEAKPEAKAGTGGTIKLVFSIHQRLTTSLLGASEPAFEPEAKTEPKK